jgi:lantibiotic modifying enzyme
MYRLLLKHQQELLSRGGPLAAFAEDEVRVVLRSTQTYSHLREESFHPDVLRDAVDRDYLMDQLWLSVPREPFLSQVMAAEQAALQRCDIPLFTTRVDSRDLWTCSGQRIPQFLRQSGLDTCIQRARHMSEDHLERQRWLIRASLATVGGPIEVQRSSSRENKSSLITDCCFRCRWFHLAAAAIIICPLKGIFIALPFT